MLNSKNAIAKFFHIYKGIVLIPKKLTDAKEAYMHKTFMLLSKSLFRTMKGKGECIC